MLAQTPFVGIYACGANGARFLPLRLTRVGTAVLGPLSRPEVMDSSAAITMEGPDEVACAVQEILATGDHPVGGSLTTAIEPRDWLSKLAPYRDARNGRALVELGVTAVPFAVLWLAMWLSLGVGYWLTLLLAVPAAGFLVRLFMIQHDCGHGSFFHGRRANDRLGRVIGVLTLTPYGHWRHEHALHHATSGNLDRRGRGDVDTLTVREFQALPRWRRWLYRVMRSPLAVLGAGPCSCSGFGIGCRCTPGAPAARHGFRSWRPISPSR